MNRKLLNEINSVHEGYIKSLEIINTATAKKAYLNSVLLDLKKNKNIFINKIIYIYYEALSRKKGYNSYTIEVDNTKLYVACSCKGVFSQERISELSKFDPESHPPRYLDISKVEIDTAQLINIALQEPPYFVLSELEYITDFDASLFMRHDKIYWRFLCENNQIGFRTLHIDAKSGEIIFNKLDRINKINA